MSELPLQLHEWMHKEMKFCPKLGCKKELTTTDLKKVCNGENIQIWKYVIQHVASAKTVQTVKGNLKIILTKERLVLLNVLGHPESFHSFVLSGLDDTYSHWYANKHTQEKLNRPKCYGKGTDSDELSEQETLEARQNDLAQNLLGFESNIQHLQRSVSQLQTDVHISEEDVNILKQKWKETEHKYVLLDKYYKFIEELIGNYQQLDDDLYKKILNLREKARNNYSKYNIEDRNVYQHNTPPIMINSTVESIEDILHNIIRKRPETESEKLLYFQKLSSEIKDHLHNHTASHIISNLTNLSRENILFLTKQNNESNSCQEKLSNSDNYKNDQFSIQELLEGERLAHIMKYLEGEKHQLDSLRYEQQGTALEVALESELIRHFSENTIALELAKEVLKTEAELVGCTESLETLQNEIVKLENDSAQLAQKKENLVTKYERIQNFHKTVDQEKNIICGLLSQNLQMAVKTFSHQKQLQEFTENSMFKCNSQTEMLCSHLRNWIMEETDIFRNTSLDRCLPVTQLSMYKQNNLLELWGNEMKEVAKVLGFKEQQAPEKLLSIAANILISNAQLKTFANNVQQLYNVISQRNINITKVDVQETSKKVEEEDKKEIENSHQTVIKYFNYLEKEIKRIDEIRDMICIWWEQPAQFISVDMKVDGRSLSHWLKLWSLAVCRLNEKK